MHKYLIPISTEGQTGDVCEPNCYLPSVL